MTMLSLPSVVYSIFDILAHSQRAVKHPASPAGNIGFLPYNGSAAIPMSNCEQSKTTSPPRPAVGTRHGELQRLPLLPRALRTSSAVQLSDRPFQHFASCALRQFVDNDELLRNFETSQTGFQEVS